MGHQGSEQSTSHGIHGIICRGIVFKKICIKVKATYESRSAYCISAGLAGPFRLCRHVKNAMHQHKLPSYHKAWCAQLWNSLCGIVMSRTQMWASVQGEFVFRIPRCCYQFKKSEQLYLDAVAGSLSSANLSTEILLQRWLSKAYLIVIKLFTPVFEASLTAGG